MKINKTTKRALISSGILLTVSFVVSIGIIVRSKEVPTSGGSGSDATLSSEQNGEDTAGDVTEDVVTGKDSATTKEATVSDIVLDEHTNYNPIHKDDSTQMLESNAQLLIRQARQLNREFKFEEANKLLTDNLRAYSLGDLDEHTIVKRLYSDSVIMSRFEEMTRDDLVTDIVVGLQNNWLVDMENFLLTTLYLPLDDREVLFINLNAINPVIKGPIDVQSVAELTGEELGGIEEKYGQTFLAASKYEIQAEDKDFEIVVIQQEDGNYGIAEFSKHKDNTAKYKTVKEWQDIRKELGISL